MKTALIIRQVIYYKVAQWCNLPCGIPPRIPRDATSVILSDVVKTQGYLSWENFMKGRIAKEWYQAQAQYCRDMPIKSTFDSTTWSTMLIKAIWSIFIDIWNAHNTHVHTEIVQTTNNILDKQVQKAFALKHSMFASDRLLFSINSTKRLRSFPESKHLWLKAVKISVYDFMVVHKRTLSQRAMTNFFSSTASHQSKQPCRDQRHWQDADTAHIPALI
eukprot:3839380-Ditylum_brightwellii.AAC.1